MTAASLQAIGLVVADMGASLAFYRLLGLELAEGAEAEDHVEVELEGGIRLMWDRVELIRGIDPAWEPPSGGARVALAFGLPDPAGVDETYAALTAAGYEGRREPWDAFWGQRYAIVKDPDGNGVDLFAPLS